MQLPYYSFIGVEQQWFQDFFVGVLTVHIIHAEGPILSLANAMFLIGEWQGAGTPGANKILAAVSGPAPVYAPRV